MARHKILICDDSLDTRLLFSDILRKHSYVVKECDNVKECIYCIENESYDLLLLDLTFPEGSGFDVLDRINELKISIPVIVISGYGSIESAVKAIRSGAYDYFSKTDKLEYLIHKIKQAIEMKSLRDRTKTIFDTDYEPIGESPAIKNVFDKIHKVADVDVSVLIIGESGVGKNKFAEYIHRISNRKDKPFQVIDCGAIPETLIEAELFGYEKDAFTGACSCNIGKIEEANGGTVFLDEIGNLSLDIQKKLLRLIDDKTIQRIGSPSAISVDVRIIGSTNENLEILVKEGKFRQDLYFRLSVFPIEIPPLRERKGDILLLAEYFLRKYSALYGKDISDFSFTVKKIFEMYKWPGNIRELENVVQQSILMSEEGVIKEEYLPDYLINSLGDVHYVKDKIMATSGKLPESVELKQLVEKYEMKIIESVMEAMEGDKNEVAEYLKITKKQLNYLIKKYGING